tara:strand:- start:7922 stop:8281 length:360 start_codon:yes stop_codon:yes gene_type:complete
MHSQSNLTAAENRLNSQSRDVVTSIQDKLHKLGYRSTVRSAGGYHSTRTFESRDGLELALVINHYNFDKRLYGVQVKVTDQSIKEHFNRDLEFLQPYIDEYLEALNAHLVYKELLGNHE